MTVPVRRTRARKAATKLSAPESKNGKLERAAKARFDVHEEEGTRTAGTHCLASEAHQWASPADGSRYALWCPPPAFVWIPVVAS